VSAQEIVKSFITALQSGETDMAATYMTDDFVCSGFGDLIPEPQDKQVFLGLQSALYSAMPDLSYNLSNLQKEGNDVTATIQITGTQSRELALPLPGGGIRVFPPSENTVILPQQNVEFMIERDNIVGMRLQHVPGGGIAGLLQQISGDMPQ